MDEKTMVNDILEGTKAELTTYQGVITEAENIQGLKEYDSIQGNKNENEDDFSKVEILIGIKTGKAIVYIGIILPLLAFLVYIIYKKIKGRKIIK